MLLYRFMLSYFSLLNLILQYFLFVFLLIVLIVNMEGHLSYI